MLHTLHQRLPVLLIPSRARSVIHSSITLPYDRACSTASNTDPSQPPLDTGEQAIYDKLSSRFPGKQLQVQDVSGGCGSFYAILISSPAFKGLNTIKQHKLVNECLKEDIKSIHGLQIKTISED
ncbi:MAG: hypothetical protein TREMPRED_001022 [Tremellales sp. Tagirdzhanova-0007]|nr:MAG: hypothetical protein TREMPRED_001022 [Tremellales sp. Tagirdzhanova-0007]